MIHFKNILILLLLLLIQIGYSQQSDSIQNFISPKATTTSGWQLIKYDGLSILGGIKHVYSRPLKWEGNQWATLAGIAAGQSILFALDEPAKAYFDQQKEDIPDLVRDFGYRFGKPLVNYGLLGGIYSLGLLTKNQKIRKTGVLLITSAIAGGILQTAGKTFIGRARPNVGEGNFSFRFYSKEAAYHSFPSGHSILSMTTTHAIAKQFDNALIKSGIYAVGLITPISRLWEGAHWLTDVTMGIALSVIVVESVDKYLKREKRYSYATKKNKIRWGFKISTNQVGFIGRF